MWQSVNEFAWHDDLALLAIAVAAVGLLLIHYKPAGRRSILATLLLFTSSLAGLFLSGVLFHLGFTAAALWLHGAFLILEGLAVIRLGAMFAFRLLLPGIGLHPPRILEDIVVFVAYIGWGFVQLHEAGLDLSGIVTTSAIITAVLAFSMQDTLGNILGGLALQIDNSIEIGDWIKVDDIVGKVSEIRWRHTAIETRNWETVIVPNSQLMKSKFSVLGRHGEDPVQWRRWVWFNVGYQTSPARVIETIEHALREADIRNVAKQPPPNCVLMDFDASYGRYALRYWLTDPQFDDPTDSAVRTHILTTLQRNGLRLATDDHTIHLIQEGRKHSLVVEAREQKRRLAAIERIALFASLADEEKQYLAQRLVDAPFAQGDRVIQQGSVAHWLYIVVSGDTEAWWQAPDGQRHLLEHRGPGSVFGEIGLMTGAPRRATVIATSDVEAYRLDKEAFRHIIEERPELADTMSAILAQRVQQLDALEQQHREGNSVAASPGSAAIGKRIREFFGLDD